MVSSSHEVMHRIFQEDPGMFPRAFRKLGIGFPDPVAVSFLPTDLTEVRPLERRVDTLLRFDSADGSGYLLAVESQTAPSKAKPSAWAYYAAHLYAKYGLPPVLLVTCQDRATERWAARPIDIGPPQWATLTVRPLVLGPGSVPMITDPEAASADLPLAVLSAVTHGKDPRIGAILKMLGAALKTADRDTAMVFSELTELGLGALPAADLWRNLVSVDLSFFRSQTAQNLRAEGRAEGEARAILRVLDRRGVPVPEEARATITACTDPGILDTWLDRALTAATIDDVLAERVEPESPSA
ncbi:hypothetical protein [Streptomyces sp. NPDC059639]|uniref:hypothetical protein n=1 Tax=Streptomyces sp. NPDC059639 TaxID=3346891 RepID=UPI0036BD0DA8